MVELRGKYKLVNLNTQLALPGLTGGVDLFIQTQELEIRPKLKRYFSCHYRKRRSLVAGESHVYLCRNSHHPWQLNFIIYF